MDKAAVAWQVQRLESLGAACGQRPPRDRAPFCVAGAALGAPDTDFAWVHRMLLLRGRCSTSRAWALPVVNGLRGTAHLVAWQVQHNSSHTTHLTQLHLHYFTYITHLPQLTPYNPSPQQLLPVINGRHQDRAPICLAGASTRYSFLRSRHSS